VNVYLLLEDALENYVSYLDMRGVCNQQAKQMEYIQVNKPQGILDPIRIIQ
jgi:hypothetical protein